VDAVSHTNIVFAPPQGGHYPYLPPFCAPSLQPGKEVNEFRFKNIHSRELFTVRLKLVGGGVGEKRVEGMEIVTGGR